MNEGFTLVNVCEDYDEDKEEGIRTWAHIFGIRRTILIAVLFSFSGVISIAALTLKMIPIQIGTIGVIRNIMIAITFIFIIKAGL